MCDKCVLNYVYVLHLMNVQKCLIHHKSLMFKRFIVISKILLDTKIVEKL